MLSPPKLEKIIISLNPIHDFSFFFTSQNSKPRQKKVNLHCLIVSLERLILIRTA